jgi:hypothetical protein
MVCISCRRGWDSIALQTERRNEELLTCRCERNKNATYPTTTSNRSSSPRITFSTCRRPSRTVAAPLSERGNLSRTMKSAEMTDTRYFCLLFLQDLRPISLGSVNWSGESFREESDVRDERPNTLDSSVVQKVHRLSMKKTSEIRARSGSTGRTSLTVIVG